jgi:hypothetical protein
MSIDHFRTYTPFFGEVSVSAELFWCAIIGHGNQLRTPIGTRLVTLNLIVRFCLQLLFANQTIWVEASIGVFDDLDPSKISHEKMDALKQHSLL